MKFPAQYIKAQNKTTFCNSEFFAPRPYWHCSAYKMDLRKGAVSVVQPLMAEKIHGAALDLSKDPGSNMFTKMRVNIT